MSDRSAHSREMPEVKRVNVVVSRYALALQRKNHKLCLNTATTKTKALRSRDDAIRSISSTRQTPPAAPVHLKPSSKQHQKQTKDSPYRSQMFVAWEILQAKLRQLQESSIGLDRQRHANLMKIYVENVSESSALLAEQLPRFLDSISQLCTSVQIAINRLSCSGISCTNPLQLKHHMEALTLDLDDLLEWIKATNIGNSITSTFSTDHEMQRLAEQSTSALLQIAHLVTELRVGGNSGKHVPNANKNDNLD
ncbi:hypothetical protein PC119_g3510 [Phytophthora cactorum]|uniref:Uncharacterized protein n=1 Tax=Phytophthora cactorum TaxID=29920 RepID=A0A8T0ZSD1_9STRA|nr:hypothetical protein PC113_g3780 [Phytophthora cactorum]KAG3037602.1 hypothetical protein PC119_g3510 [Phytophthora cactorum]